MKNRTISPASQTGFCKKQYSQFIAVAFLIMLSLTSCNESGQQNGGSGDSITTKKISPEDTASRDNSTVNFCNLPDAESGNFDYGQLHDRNCVYSYNITNLNDAVTDFKSHFKNRAGQPLEPLKQEVDIASLDILINDINTKYAGQISGTDHRAIRMYYGINENGQMIIIFEPVLLKTITKTKFKILEVQKYYVAVNGSLIEKNATEKDNYIEAYRSSDNSKRKIKIIHVTRGLPDFFNENDNDFNLGDTKYSTISLKQIYDMYIANKESGGTCSGTDKITFQIVASSYYVGVVNYKLHVIAYYTVPILDNETDPNNYKGLGADFTQMNPPYKDDEIFLPATQDRKEEKVKIKSSGKIKRK